MKVETQVVFGSMLTETVSQIHHVSSTSLLIFPSKDTGEDSAMLWTSAKTVSHHHAQLERLAKAHAKLLTLRNTMSAIIMVSLEKQR